MVAPVRGNWITNTVTTGLDRMIYIALEWGEGIFYKTIKANGKKYLASRDVEMH